MSDIENCKNCGRQWADCLRVEPKCCLMCDHTVAVSGFVLGALTLKEIQVANYRRNLEWHLDDAEPWTGADYGNEMGGEVGEAQNVIKKLRRIETGVAKRGGKTREELLEMLREEIADVIITAANVANYYEIDLSSAVVGKFNATSDKYDLPQRL